jgi:hypothetical protein
MKLSTTHTVAAIKYVIQQLGTTATLNKATGTNYRTFAVLETIKSDEVTSTAGMGATSHSVMHIPGDIRQPPEVGDYITVNKQQWFITDVQTEKPAGLVLSYTVSVT